MKYLSVSASIYLYHALLQFENHLRSSLRIVSEVNAFILNGRKLTQYLFMNKMIKNLSKIIITAYLF